MKLEILQENFNWGLTMASRAISSRPSLPILSHFLLQTTGGQFKITASNPENTVVIPLGAKIDEEGELAVPARTLSEVVATLNSEKIKLEVKEGSLHLSAGKFHGKINGVPASEFPIPSIAGEDSTSLVLDRNTLARAISQTIFSCATDESRAVLTGVYFQFASEGLKLAATDGFRLSVASLGGGNSHSWGGVDSLLLPAKSVVEVMKLLSEKNDEQRKEDGLTLSTLPGNPVLFTIGDVKLISKIISGNFPNFEKIIPSEVLYRYVIEIGEFLKAIKLASVFARENANIVRLIFQGSTLIVKAQGSQIGENESELDVQAEKKAEGELVIAFNYRYLLDFLGSVPKETEFSLEFSGPTSSGVFRPIKEKSYLHLIMPVRIQS